MLGPGEHQGDYLVGVTDAAGLTPAHHIHARLILALMDGQCVIHAQTEFAVGLGGQAAYDYHRAGIAM